MMRFLTEMFPRLNCPHPLMLPMEVEKENYPKFLVNIPKFRRFLLDKVTSIDMTSSSSTRTSSSSSISTLRTSTTLQTAAFILQSFFFFSFHFSKMISKFTYSILYSCFITFLVGGSINPQTGEEDISPYATFHLLGMREENKNGPHPAGAANFQTMPHPPHQQQGPPQQAGQPMTQQPQQPTTPARQASQTMNVSLKRFIYQQLFFALSTTDSSPYDYSASMS